MWPTASDIDAISLNFDGGSLVVLNVILALIMFGVALALRVDDFREVAQRPRAPVIGMAAQFILLPAATWALTRALGLPPSISLGMILVASCPGGNMSNFMTHLAGANTALSISMTALSTAAAIVMTPLNVAFWGSMSADTRALMTDFAINPLTMIGNVVLILGVPLLLGMSVRARFPDLAKRMETPFKRGSVLLFALLLIVAFQANLDAFLKVIGLVGIVVALHNALAWVVGYGAGRIAGLPPADRRALAVEVAIQNSGLGLVLIFGFFGGLGGMAVIAGWWGIWHILAGLFMALLWGKVFPIPVLDPPSRPA
jgi:bile acid:Na+ symporter, BASS family